MSVYDVTAYGAVGDGVTDDTAAIQAAVNAAVLGQGECVFPAAKAAGSTSQGQNCYKISSAINIPLPADNISQNWSLIGQGGVATILQATDATPIFYMLGKGNSQFINFRIENFQGVWANQQVYPTAAAPNANLMSCVIMFDVGFADGWFFFTIRNINNLNGCRCISFKQYNGINGYTGPYMTQPNGAVWGGLFERISGYYSSTGGVLNLNCGGGNGQPNIQVNHAYLNQGNQSEEMFFLTGIDTIVLTDVELNFTRGLIANLLGSRNIHFHGCRIEAATFDDTPASLTLSRSCFSAIGTHLDINGFSMENSTFNFTQPRSLFSNIDCSATLKRISFASSINVVNAGGGFSLITSGGGDQTQLDQISDFPVPALQLASAPTASVSCESQRVMSFYKNGLVATASNVPNTSSATIIDEIVDVPSWIFGLELYVNNPLTAGMISVQIFKNGIALDPSFFAVVGPPLVTTGTTIGNDLHFASNLPSWVAPGMVVSDITKPSNIPGGAVIFSVGSNYIQFSPYLPSGVSCANDTIAIGSEVYTKAPRFTKAIAITQCKNPNVANGAYQLARGDALHVVFTTLGMAGATAAKANIILADLGGAS